MLEPDGHVGVGRVALFELCAAVMGLNIVVVATGRLSKEGGSNDRGKLACWPLDCRPEACRVGSIYGGLGL